MTRTRPTLALLVAVCGPALAADAVSYQQLLDADAGLSSPQALIGKSVTVRATGQDDLGYFVRKSDALTFHCDSGEPGLKALKRKAPTFRGVITKFQGWDGATVFTLKDCSLATGAAAQAGIALDTAGTGTAAGSVLYHHPGSKERPEGLLKPSRISAVGKINRDHDPGGWKYVLVAGKKEIRITYEGSDPMSMALMALSDQEATVSVSGVVGAFPGGYLAFDTTQPIVIARN
jgi:hypothetical protein